MINVTIHLISGMQAHDMFPLSCVLQHFNIYMYTYIYLHIHLILTIYKILRTYKNGLIQTGELTQWFLLPSLMTHTFDLQNLDSRKKEPTSASNHLAFTWVFLHLYICVHMCSWMCIHTQTCTHKK